MILMPLMLAGAMAFGHGPAVDQRPFSVSRADAIRAAATVEPLEAPAPADTHVRYPSADGDILADVSPRTAAPPLPPARPLAAGLPPTSPRPASPRPAVDASGLLGGPRF